MFGTNDPPSGVKLDFRRKITTLAFLFVKFATDWHLFCVDRIQNILITVCFLAKQTQWIYDSRRAEKIPLDLFIGHSKQDIIYGARFHTI